MKILFIAALSLVVLSVILFIISKVVNFIDKVSLFRDILDGEMDAVDKACIDALDELKAVLEMFGNGLSRFKYALLLLSMCEISEIEYQLKNHGWKTGVLGGTALYATCYPSSFLNTVFSGFFVSLGVIFCLNLGLNIFVKVLVYFRCKYIYENEKSQS